MRFYLDVTTAVESEEPKTLFVSTKDTPHLKNEHVKPDPGYYLRFGFSNSSLRLTTDETKALFEALKRLTLTSTSASVELNGERV